VKTKQNLGGLLEDTKKKITIIGNDPRHKNGLRLDHEPKRNLNEIASYSLRVRKPKTSKEPKPERGKRESARSEYLEALRKEFKKTLDNLRY
jgi:uncharacterized protein YnzC (UPF0291/DUF896 family)